MTNLFVPGLFEFFWKLHRFAVRLQFLREQVLFENQPFFEAALSPA
jgi:hypothetical protein